MPSPPTTTRVWRPSNARRLVLDGFLQVPRGAAPGALPPLSWPAKDPADVLDYEFDITPALLGNDGDGIATVTVTITPGATGDLVLNSVAADGRLAVLCLSAGVAGTVYTVLLEIATLNGRTLSRAVLLPVLSLSSAAMPRSTLTTDQGLVVTDQNGNPILIGS